MENCALARSTQMRPDGGDSLGGEGLFPPMAQAAGLGWQGTSGLVIVWATSWYGCDATSILQSVQRACLDGNRSIIEML